ncbi:MAG: methionyl-tRNA formyltransferase [Myxococcota bacterium]
MVAAYGRILPQALLNLPRLGCINVHASLLPKHRGASPITHAILAGDREVGVSIMQMDAGLDTGPVISTRAITAPQTATCGNLTIALAELGAKLLIETLPSILSETAEATPQEDAAATYAPLLNKEDGRLDFSLDAAQLLRRIRALSPWPGAYTYKEAQRIQVLRASLATQKGPPGKVIAADKQGVCVGCAKNSVLLQEVKPAGKKAMSAASWVAGRGIASGDILG